MTAGTSGWPSWVDGELHAPGAGRVSVDDTGLQLGLAVFETLRFAEGLVWFQGEHVERLTAGANALGIQLAEPARELDRALAAYLPVLEQVLADRGESEAALRVTLTRGAIGGAPAFVVGARSVTRPPAEGVVLTVERRAKLAGDPLERIKSTDRARNVLALERAQAGGAWDALLCNERDDVCEATIANVFVVVDGILRTPSEECGCLAGVTRGCILRGLAGTAQEARVGPIALEELARASEVVLTNSTGRVFAARAVPGHVERLAGSDGAALRCLDAALGAAEDAYRAASATPRRST